MVEVVLGCSACLLVYAVEVQQQVVVVLAEVVAQLVAGGAVDVVPSGGGTGTCSRGMALVVVPSGSCGGTFGTTSRRGRGCCCGSFTGWNCGGCCASCSLVLVLCSCRYL